MKRPAILAVIMVVVQGCASSTPSGSAVPTGAPSTVPTGQATSAIAPSTTPSGMAWPAAVSLPTAGRIVFTIEREGGLHAAAYIDARGFHLIPTGGDDTFGNATWAPDSAVLFDSERAGRRHIFRMGLDGGSVAQLTTGDTTQDSVGVSPDGTLMAFGDVSATADLGIHVANIDGTGVRALTGGAKPGVAGEDHAAFSPDGKWIAFDRVVDPAAGLVGLFIVRVDGTEERRLTADSLGGAEPRWSPDGERILFVGGSSDLWVVDAVGGTPTQLNDPADPGLFTDADWSPDGTQIVYRHFTPGAPASIELWIADADGTHARVLWVAPLGYGANRPDWGD